MRIKPKNYATLVNVIFAVTMVLALGVFIYSGLEDVGSIDETQTKYNQGRK